jgi:hypothetical protein
MEMKLQFERGMKGLQLRRKSAASRQARRKILRGQCSTPIQIGNCLSRLAEGFGFNVRVEPVDFLGVVSDEFLHNGRADPGIFHQAGRRVTQRME